MSRLHGNAMVNNDGAVFQPATVEDARRIEAEHHARPAAPERWPWPCPSVQDWAVTYVGWVRVQCRRVAGHAGGHLGEVTW